MLKLETDHYQYDSSYQRSTTLEMDFPAQKTSAAPRHKLRLATSSPILHQLYQSDEEQPSPSADDFTDSNDETSKSGSASDASESGEEEDDEMDFEDDFDTPRALPTLIEPSVLAVAVPMLAFGRPKVITISKLAPMAKRITPIVRPQSASYTTIRKFKAPLPTPIRTSAVFDQDFKVPQKYNTPYPPQRADSLTPPSYTYSGSSPSSSSNSSFMEEEHELDEAELLIRESDEIQSRSTSVPAGTDWEVDLEAPTPTSYAEYDPFALSPPRLAKSKEYAEVTTPTRTKRWRTLGLRRPKAVR